MPFDWKHFKIFYGWWIAGASFFIAFYVSGVVFYGFTAIFEPIANELGWSYTQISIAASLRGLEMGLFAPLIGILTDRLGPRRIIFGGAIISAMGLIILSQTMSLGMFYIAFVVVSVGMSCCTMTVLLTAVANWFQSKIGIASGIAVSGFGFGGLLIPVMVRLIEMYEWRTTMVILAIGMLGIILPLSMLFRHKPEQYGYLPDGEDKAEVTIDNTSEPLKTVDADITARQALKGTAFWLLALSFTYHMIIVSAITAHVMPYLSSIGVARSISSLVATGIPLMSIGGRIGLGWLGDKLNRRRVAAGAFAIMGLGSLCFGYCSGVGTWLLVPFLVLFGIGYGGSNALRASLGMEYFGRTYFGTIFGLMIGINMLGSMVGPPLAGWIYDSFGSYQRIWLILAGLAAVAVISVLAIPAAKTMIKLRNRNQL